MLPADTRSTRVASRKILAGPSCHTLPSQCPGATLGPVDLASWNAQIGYDWAEIAPGVQARLPRFAGGGGSNENTRVVLEVRRDPGDAGVTASAHPVAPGDDGVTFHVTAHIQGADLYRAVARQMHLHAQRNPGR